MSKVFHREPRKSLPVAMHGEGAWIVDAAGKRYLDASGGAAVSCLGHSDRDVIDAIKSQLDRIPFAHSAFFTTEAAEELADVLIADAPAGIGHVYFVSGGSEAVEAALKMARQYCIEKGEGKRTRFIARRQSYHGNTLGALSVGGNVWRRDPYKEMLMPTVHIAPCYPYRDKRPGENDEAYGRRVADELEAAIMRLGPETVCAFVAETVGGATAGVLPPVAGYFKRIREICDRYGVLLILDEVMCGMGRTGTMHAVEQDGIAPDLLCIAKGLGAGYQPIGAVMVADKVFSAIVGGTGAFQHGHTYMAHPTACAAALAVQRKIRDARLLANVRRQGDALARALAARFGNHPHVGDVRGRGLFRGVELVMDRGTKEPFDPTLKLNQRIKAHAMLHGLICYPGGGTVDGKRGDHILLAPPFIVTEDEVAEVVDRLATAIDGAITETRA